MRRILVDHARARNAAKRGGGRRVGFDADHTGSLAPAAHLEEIDEALTNLAADKPQVAELVQLRYFGGLTLEQCAAALGVSARTADTWWSYARAWLAVELVEG
jgi:RNA polymerase sigma factor (TIGR02999 family)